MIGILPNPTEHIAWPDIRSMLDPAAKLGGVPVLEEHELVWIVTDGPTLVAAATTRITKDRFAEVICVGGSRFREWLGDLSDLICRWAKDEGMERVVAGGRRGWAKHLEALGWRVVGSQGRVTEYERGLKP